MIISFFAHLIASFITLPILAIMFFFILFYLIFQDKKVAIQWTMVGSTFFIMLSISKTIEQLWSISFTWLLIALVLCVALGLTYLQYRLRGEIFYDRLFKGTFTISFLLFLPIHVLLYLWVIISSLTTSVFGSS